MPLKVNPTTGCLDMVMAPGTGTATIAITVNQVTGPGVQPVVPDSGGMMTVVGTVVANQSVPIETRSVNVNQYNIAVQQAASDTSSTPAKSGVAHFNSNQFTVDVDGFVELIGGGAAMDSLSDDVDMTVSPDGMGNIKISGGPGITTTSAANEIIINSVIYVDRIAGLLPTDSGTFATAVGAYTLPASPLQGELIEIVCITTGIIVTANTSQTIQINQISSTVAGTATNSASGDALFLRYRTVTKTWHSINNTGIWSLA